MHLSHSHDSMLFAPPADNCNPLAVFPSEPAVLTVHMPVLGAQVYTAGLENVIKAWDLRKSSVALTLKGHSDTVTGLRVSPDGSHLLSNSMDNTLRVWDMRPYAPANRCTKVFTGHQHSFEKNLLRCDWSPDGSKVCPTFCPVLPISPTLDWHTNTFCTKGIISGINSTSTSWCALLQTTCVHRKPRATLHHHMLKRHYDDIEVFQRLACSSARAHGSW